MGKREEWLLSGLEMTIEKWIKKLPRNPKLPQLYVSGYSYHVSAYTKPIVLNTTTREIRSAKAAEPKSNEEMGKGCYTN